MNIYIKKMGCKVNEYEASSIMTELTNLGHNEVNNVSLADIAIVFTCAVTNEAESKSRQMVSKIYKLNPNIKTIVCGCSSQNNAEQYITKNGVIAVFGMNKLDIIKLIDNLQNFDSLPFVNCQINKEYDNYCVPKMNKTRHFVKIQDGCDNFCSYCLIPYLRGRSRSRDLQDVVREIEIASKSSKEIVITGIDVSNYKTKNGETLKDLIKSIKDIEVRLRFSSLECNIIDEELLLLLKQCKNFCPHFHLPLQSGANQTLKDMNRHYTKEKFLEKIELIRKHFGDCGITTDVIVGFPTETQKDFEETLDTINKAKFSDIHAFPYSNRVGTVISKIAKPLASEVVNHRQQILLQLKHKLHNEFMSRHIDKTAEVLTENIKGDYITGYTKEYIKVLLPKNEIKSSVIVNVKLLNIIDNEMLAKKI